jgi:hypothetical protein
LLGLGPLIPSSLQFLKGLPQPSPPTRSPAHRTALVALRLPSLLHQPARLSASLHWCPCVALVSARRFRYTPRSRCASGHRRPWLNPGCRPRCAGSALVVGLQRPLHAAAAHLAAQLALTFFVPLATTALAMLARIKASRGTRVDSDAPIFTMCSTSGSQGYQLCCRGCRLDRRAHYGILATAKCPRLWRWL